jgi:FlaA1/EpsC-like NDP-sugar epimerase
MFKIVGKYSEHLQESLRWLFQHYSLPRWLVFIVDNLAVFFTFILAYLLRFNFVLSDFSVDLALRHALLALIVYASFALVFRSYSGLIRHTTVVDIFYVFIATTCSLFALLGITMISRIAGWSEIFNIPLSITLIHYVTLTLLLFFIRIMIKVTYQYISSSFSNKKKVLIFGAGAMGVIVKRVIQSDVKSDYQIAGFLDGNKKLQGKKLTGIPVYNPNILTEKFLKKHDIDAMIFAIKEISPVEKSKIIRSAIDLGLLVLETPAVESWLNGQFHINQIHKVNVEDLLGREPIKLNLKRIGIGLTGKTVLVTGAAGSIGSEIVRQLTRFRIKKLVLIDQAETAMFLLENELKAVYNNCPTQTFLADVTLMNKMERIFQEVHPDVIFHAAAYKHVPLLEENPHEAIRVNVGGTKVISQLAVKYAVKKFVMISTDKAVKPVNVMGASKRICEVIVQLKAQKPGNRTQFIITRFGNVLGSNGSVIPIFSNQIENGGPVTVTHPQITRYFMTIPEACQLVLEAGFMGNGGEIFVFDMGEPVKIADLARQMIRLSGLIPGKDIKIEYTGLRPGEKLYEELWSEQETLKPTHHPKIKIAEVEKINNTELFAKIEKLLSSLYFLSDEGVVDYCKELIPEYNKYDESALKVIREDDDSEVTSKSENDYFSHKFRIA